MKDTEKIIEIAKYNFGVVTTDMVEDIGISRGVLKYLSDNGKLEKVSRGVYIVPDAWDDEYVNIQNRFKKGIFSLDTALFLHDLTDRMPNKFHMSFPATYNLTNPKSAGIICRNISMEVYNLGICEVLTPYGHKVKAYNPEKTLCDILKKSNKTDIQLVSEAFKRYILRKDKDIQTLSEYAQIIKVEDRLRSYLEVLL